MAQVLVLLYLGLGPVGSVPVGLELGVTGDLDDTAFINVDVNIDPPLAFEQLITELLPSEVPEMLGPPPQPAVSANLPAPVAPDSAPDVDTENATSHPHPHPHPGPQPSEVRPGPASTNSPAGDAKPKMPDPAPPTGTTNETGPIKPHPHPHPHPHPAKTGKSSPKHGQDKAPRADADQKPPEPQHRQTPPKDRPNPGGTPTAAANSASTSIRLERSTFASSLQATQNNVEHTDGVSLDTVVLVATLTASLIVVAGVASAAVACKQRTEANLGRILDDIDRDQDVDLLLFTDLGSDGGDDDDVTEDGILEMGSLGVIL